MAGWKGRSWVLKKRTQLGGCDEKYASKPIVQGSWRGILQLEPDFAKRKRRHGERRTARIGDLKKQTQSWLARARRRDLQKRSQWHWGPFFQLAEREKAPKTEMARRF
jgi:hypothetical protein